MGPEETSSDGGQEDGGKLVRDRVSEILRAAGLQPVVTVLNETAYHRALRRKLLEEAREAAEADDTALLDELAHLHELVAVLARIAGASLEDVATQAERKRAARGGFNQRLRLAVLRYRRQPGIDQHQRRHHGGLAAQQGAHDGNEQPAEQRQRPQRRVLDRCRHTRQRSGS